MSIRTDGATGVAINYPLLTGRVRVGDEVLVNTTAVALGLGTGGVYFVMANLTRLPEPKEAPGHIMKARYTPHQTDVLCLEEPQHPDHALVSEFVSLRGKPVLLAMLHSMSAPAAAGVRAACEGRLDRTISIAYIMTDSAALPLAFSTLARRLRSAEILDRTITCGQAFGGEREAVNLYTALMAAAYNRQGQGEEKEITLAIKLPAKMEKVAQWQIKRLNHQNVDAPIAGWKVERVKDGRLHLRGRLGAGEMLLVSSP